MTTYLSALILVTSVHVRTTRFVHGAVVAKRRVFIHILGQRIPNYENVVNVPREFVFITPCSPPLYLTQIDCWWARASVCVVIASVVLDDGKGDTWHTLM
jgi:hypothetical protein